MLTDFPLCAVISWFFDLGSAFSGLVGKRLGDVWVGFECLSVPGSAHQLSSARGGHGSRCVTVCNRNAGWRDWCSPCTRCRGHARQHQCHHAGLHVHVSMHVDRLGEGVQGKTLPGRLELPTLRLTASHSDQLSLRKQLRSVRHMISDSVRQHWSETAQRGI